MPWYFRGKLTSLRANGSRERAPDDRLREAIQVRHNTTGWIASRSLLATTVLGLSSPHIKDEAGDDEHCRHRQHLRERFRGRLFGGFLHADLPRLGHDSSLREKRLRRSVSYSEHPATKIRFTSPHSANIDCAKVEQ